MGIVIAIQSAKGGSGGTTLLTNLAAVLMQAGQKVCIVDACLDPYALAAVFEIKEENVKHSLTNFFIGQCSIKDAIIPLPLEPDAWGPMKGSMSIVLSSMKPGEQAFLLKNGYDTGLLNDALSELAGNFDFVLTDGGDSFSEEMLLGMAFADIVIMNSEWKYLTKANAFIDIAHKLDVPRLFVVLNLVPKKVFEIPASEFRNVFNLPMALIPNSMDIRDERGVFAISRPDHPITKLFRKILQYILAADYSGNSSTVMSLEKSEVGELFSDADTQASLLEKKLRVFLWHSPLDKLIVQDWYQKLLFEGWIDPWYDEEKLLPGQNRELEVEKALESADAVLLFLSDNSVNGEGYVQKEIRKILEVWEEKPESAIFLLPVRLDKCEMPRDLRQLQRVDSFDASAYPKIKKALQVRFQTLPRSRN